MLKRVNYIGLLDELNIDKQSCIIVGSGLLALLGIRPNADLDILVTAKEFEKLRQKHITPTISELNHPCLKYGNLAIYYTWPGPSPDTKRKIVQTAVEVGGFRFWNIDCLIRWKLWYGREKDMNDLLLIWKKYKDIWGSISLFNNSTRRRYAKMDRNGMNLDDTDFRWIYVFKQKSHMIHEPKDAPAWFRCPECGRRLKPKLIDCHYGVLGAEECWHWNIPPHKKKGRWKLGKRKKTSRDI